ncbi:hypothetical protein [Chromobacterium violaceum]|uniref:hypothetical protein n=1 Tax=Chromobacterium violaceum TaxID=536 RepID=UPI00111C233D|nr:hypothetical protein [Chromobacterium violaceum]QRO33939.1 hypothetical protein I6K04_04140 [Chromobacterium violaceum]QRQ16257.1 hypothetical protein I6K03_18590 [Chromobacterium violaceum]
MIPGIEKEHAVETYKSLISISTEGIKVLGLLNGGAAVSILAFLGNISSKIGKVPDLRFAMAAYVVGLFLYGVCFVLSYLTQLRLFNESMGRGGKHSKYLNWAIYSCLFSLFCFLIGSIAAVCAFQVLV